MSTEFLTCHDDSGKVSQAFDLMLGKPFLPLFCRQNAVNIKMTAKCCQKFDVIMPSKWRQNFCFRLGKMLVKIFYV